MPPVGCAFCSQLHLLAAELPSWPGHSHARPLDDLTGPRRDGYRSEPAVWWNDGMGEYMAELARRFAASYISVQMHTSFNTEYRKLKDQKPGAPWFSLAEAATQAIAAQGQQAEAFLRSEIKGPPQ